MTKLIYCLPFLFLLKNKNHLKTKSIYALEFCKQNNFDTTKCILIDMSIHSGLPRFFVWDFTEDSVLIQSQVCNGRKSEKNNSGQLVFSNKPVSNCTSLGKYAILNRGYSNHGINIHYILKGLEASNNNAQKRTIVLHSKDEVSDVPIYPKRLVTSRGCPTLSNNFMKIIDAILKNKTSPVLLWIYE